MTHYLPPDYEQLRDRTLKALDAVRLLVARGEVDGGSPEGDGVYRRSRDPRRLRMGFVEM